MKNQKREGKMCKYRDSKSLKEQAYRCSNRFGIDSNPCPEYANESCQIITPKKKKSGVVKAKIEGTWRIDSGVDHGVIISGVNVSLLHADIPILIDRKYIGGKKC